MKNGKSVYGVGQDRNIITSAIKALLNGVNRSGAIGKVLKLENKQAVLDKKRSPK